MEKLIYEFKKKFEQFAKSSSKEEFESNLKPFISAAFDKLDVVPRKEFEKQKEMLKRAQDRLNELEESLDELIKKK
tara:strand:+ start:215 stop:442 length:228 start_codon:yes stop_codon:yes gene_type:complete